MRYAVIFVFCLSLGACAVDTGPGTEVGASSEALSYADNCVVKAFVTTDNGSFVVGKVVGDGTNIRGHWMHLSEPIPAAAPAASCDDSEEEGDCECDDEGRGERHHGRWGHDEDDDAGDCACDGGRGHGRWGHDEDDDAGDCACGGGRGHGRWGHDEDDDRGRSGRDDDGEDGESCDDGAPAPARHVIVGRPTSLLCRPNGGFLAHVEGDAIFDGVPGYTFALQLDDLSGRGLPNQYVMVVFDSTGAVVYSDPFDQVQTGRSSVVITGPPSLPTP